jgi:hypothetical protein
LRLSGLDSSVLVISLFAAGILYALRKTRKVPSPPGQGLFDMLGVWTTIELVLIIFSTIQEGFISWAGLRLPDPGELIRSNGILVPVALVYSAILVAKSTFVASILEVSSVEKAGG